MLHGLFALDNAIVRIAAICGAILGAMGPTPALACEDRAGLAMIARAKSQRL